MIASFFFQDLIFCEIVLFVFFLIFLFCCCFNEPNTMTNATDTSYM